MVHDNAVAHFYGTGLRFDVLRVDDKDVPFVLGNWPNGESFAVRYLQFDQGQIILHEVPEPEIWALLAIAAAGICAGRLRSIHRCAGVSIWSQPTEGGVQR